MKIAEILFVVGVFSYLVFLCSLLFMRKALIDINVWGIIISYAIMVLVLFISAFKRSKYEHS